MEGNSISSQKLKNSLMKTNKESKKDKTLRGNTAKNSFKSTVKSMTCLTNFSLLSKKTIPKIKTMKRREKVGMRRGSPQTTLPQRKMSNLMFLIMKGSMTREMITGMALGRVSRRKMPKLLISR